MIRKRKHRSGSTEERNNLSHRAITAQVSFGRSVRQVVAAMIVLRVIIEEYLETPIPMIKGFRNALPPFHRTTHSTLS